VALVIGNGRYRELPLPNPENDAKLVAATLGTLGFEVEQHFNLKSADFRKVVRDFGRRMDDDEVASVFFYAGHGMQIDRRNYLLPVDLNLRDEDEVKDESIDVADQLLSRIDRVRPRARIFIIDACRDNPFRARPGTRSVRVSAGLAEMAAPGALIAFSAAPGGVAEDGPAGKNSVYTRHLANEMRTEGLEVEEMLKRVRIKVLLETQERQIPYVNTSMVVNFVFNPGSGIAAAGRPERGPGARNLKLEIRAEAKLNTDRAQAPAPLALRIYQLRDGEAFKRASFDNLYDQDEPTLGAALVRREELHLRPGETRNLEVLLGEDARFVGVLAAFRELAGSQWRTLLPIPAEASLPIARLHAQARQVDLAWAS
jgi:type VI secretion system VasD/TssJ family lipoprotein